jgi:hypothetical protein
LRNSSAVHFRKPESAIDKQQGESDVAALWHDALEAARLDFQLDQKSTAQATDPVAENIGLVQRMRMRHMASASKMKVK